MIDLRKANFKVLNADGSAIYGRGSWPLPDGDRPGEWLESVGDVRLCSNGLHFCTADHLMDWLGPRIFVIETSGPVSTGNNKSACSRARLLCELTTWNERTARLLAADYAERVLSLFERRYEGDDRPRNAIRVARAFANGDATQEELAAARDAAGAAARDAAGAAARAAARDAERKWQTDRLFEYLEGKLP